MMKKEGVELFTISPEGLEYVINLLFYLLFINAIIFLPAIYSPDKRLAFVWLSLLGLSIIFARWMPFVGLEMEIIMNKKRYKVRGK